VKKKKNEFKFKNMKKKNKKIINVLKNGEERRRREATKRKRDANLKW
jgi:hypothetical protein